MPSPMTRTHTPGTFSGPSTGDHLDTPVREIMTPGVLTIAEDASLRHAYRAMVAHSVHALLVVGRKEGRPLGWVTARGLLALIGRDDSLASTREAITERPTTIEPSATAREALTALCQAGVSHLLVARNPEVSPEGVLAAIDLIALEGA